MIARHPRASPGTTAAKHRPRKRFGQHFLVDRGYIDRIVAAIAPAADDTIVEIGPGLAALTRPLLDRVARLQVVEIDRDLAAQLAAQWPADRLRVHVADALQFDFGALGENLRVVGNLPYNVSSPLLFHLAAFAPRLRDITVMLQKEVVQRIAAAPATPDYGRLSVMLQVAFAAKRLFDVPPGAFRPPPKVDSAVVRLVPLDAAPAIADRELFAAVVGAAFGQRRKTLRNALIACAAANDFAEAEIDPGARGETLPVGAFVRLANAIARRSDASG